VAARGPAAVAALEDAVLNAAPPGSVVIGTSISPAGEWAVAAVLYEPASYVMDEVFHFDEGVWRAWGGGSGEGLTWSNEGDDDAAAGVLRSTFAAPRDARTATVEYEGERYELPVSHGHVFFAAWDTVYTDEPRLIGYDVRG